MATSALNQQWEKVFEAHFLVPCGNMPNQLKQHGQADMTVKVFISYAHKDEIFKEALNEHLTMLKRNGVISEWHDRKIVPGEDWKNQISQNLEESALILFLVSSTFLSSEYCYDIEFTRALEKHHEGSAQLIPVVIRPCDWTASKLGTFQGLPKDALAISKWVNQDEGWVDVVQGIKKHVAHFTPKVTVKSTTLGPLEKKGTVSSSTSTWLNDTEVVLSHRKVNKILLPDIYIALDMEEVRVSRNDELVIKSTSHMLAQKGRYILSGEEQQGKTTMLKQAFRHFAAAGIPVAYFDGASINTADLNKILATAINDQFDGLSFTEFDSAAEKVILLDNLHEIGLNDRYRNSFLEIINARFDYVIVTCGTSFMYLIPEIAQLDEYKKFELLGLGHLRRAEIIEKWVSLGVEECIPELDLFNRCDEIKEKLDAVIRKNIVPSKPIYILMLLQMLEAGSQQNLDLSSYGHCYQQLIYKSFDNAKVPKKEFDTYLNVLTELSWVLHQNDSGINQAKLETFFQKYGEVYLSVDGNLMIEKLKSNSILHERDFKIQFKYPYLFYFFVAKKIAESYSTSEQTRLVVKTLIENLHREDYANILVFVTHHTKEKWVLDEIDRTLQSLFSEHSPARLSRDQLAFMQEFISKIPELVIEQREIREERTKHNAALDAIEREDDHPIELSVESKKLISADLPAVINKTFKGMELSGQIIRNRHATLPKATLLSLAEQGAFCGLRFLNFFIDISDATKAEIIKYVASSLRTNPELTNAEIEEHATSHFVTMTYGVINGVIRKIASSIGSKEAAEIYAQIQEANPVLTDAHISSLEKMGQSPAITLLNQAISMQFTRKLDIPRLNETYSKLKNNPVCLRILKDMAVQHIYMFPIGYREKQQLAELLGVTVRSQRMMDRKKVAKG